MTRKKVEQIGYEDLFHPVELLPHPDILGLVDQAFDYKMSWNEVFQTLRAERRKPLNVDEIYNFSGRVGEIILNTGLKGQFQNDERFQFDPIEDGTINYYFKFHKNQTGALLSLTSLGSWSVAEYDSLFLFEDIPVVIESKLSHNTGIINNAFNRDHIRKIAMPIQEHFDTDKIIYISIVPPEFIVRAGADPDSILNKYLNYSGLILPYYCTYADFLSSVKNALENTVHST